MTVEIREMVVRTTIVGSRSHEAGETIPASDLEEVKREVLAACMARLVDYLERQKER